MIWFKRHQQLLEKYSKELSSNSNYHEVWQCRGKYFISCGDIIVRSDKTDRLPVLIVYTDSTPYTLPSVFLLSTTISQEISQTISNYNSIYELADALKDKIKLYYFRHQNADGSLCLLDADNLGDDNIEWFSADQVIDRVWCWFKSFLNNELLPELPQVESYAHYPKKYERVEIIYPDSFNEGESSQGQFYAFQIASLPFKEEEKKVIFLGNLITQETQAGIQTPIESYSKLQNFPEGIKSPLDLLNKTEMLDRWFGEEILLIGYYFSLTNEPPIFRNYDDIAEYIGSGNVNVGYDRLLKKLSKDIKKLLPLIYLGFRYINRRSLTEWHFICLEKKDNPFSLIGESIEIFKEILSNNYIIKAVRSELFSENSYHSRNTGCTDRDVLKSKEITIIGCGAIGSEIADIFSKAGIGKLNLLDFDVFRAHNSVRHLCSLSMIGFPKVIAVHFDLIKHNPFVLYNLFDKNILRTDINEYMSNDTIGISSIADDNIEGYLNEQAIINNKIIFYVRALRGGKAGRIFRVIPGKDACFYCLTLYKKENDLNFIDIPLDEKMPTLYTECNNPVRPASAAELKLISSIASRVILDYIQDRDTNSNQWIWQTENGKYIKNHQGEYFSLIKQTYTPHLDCPCCSQKNEIKIQINEEVKKTIICEIDKNTSIETGGVLVGFINMNIINIAYASSPGPEAVMQPNKFNRDVSFCQKFLDDLFKKTDGKIIYLGEWHYHPQGSSYPSEIDLSSMASISRQENYLVETPVMIIASRDKQLSCTVHPHNKKYYNVIPEFYKKQ